MSIVVTGATGPFGRTVVESLLAQGVAADQLVATGRAVGKIADLAQRGVAVRVADFDEPAGLPAAFDGAQKVLLVSGSEVGRRIPQHRNAVDAAVAAGAGLLVYTSAPYADSTSLQLAAEHLATEEYIRASGLPYVFLRNSWYLENYTGKLPDAIENGVVLGAAGAGRVSAALRREYAEAAAAVLLLPIAEVAGSVFELGGDEAFTLTEYAQQVAQRSGRPVAYRDLSADEYASTLAGFGLPAELAGIIADSDAGIGRGELLVTSGDLSRLIGRPTTTLREALVTALG
jgi:NAD(P)H dehydrogenase (quinone)